MSDYIKQLEEQNEELQKKLSDTEDRLNVVLHKIPRWEKSAHGVYHLSIGGTHLAQVIEVAPDEWQAKVQKIGFDRGFSSHKCKNKLQAFLSVQQLTGILADIPD